MTDIIEFYHFYGMCGRVALTALEEVNATYSINLVNYFSESARSAYYTDINPIGRFPAIKIGSHVITENAAILFYINDIYPGAGLFPPTRDALGIAMQRADIIYCAATLHPILTRIRSPTRIIDGKDSQLLVLQKAYDTLMPHLQRIDLRLRDNGGYWYGQWSIMDSYLSWIYWIASGCHVDLAHLGHLSDLFQRVSERPSTQRMLAREGAAMAAAGVAEPQL